MATRPDARNIADTTVADHLPDAAADLQAIIAAKISLREEIKAELRAEFSSLVSGVSGVAEAKTDAIAKEVESWRLEVIRQADERSLRYQQRFEALEREVSRGELAKGTYVTQEEINLLLSDFRQQMAIIRAMNKEILETRLDAGDDAKRLLAEEIDKRQKITDKLLADLKAVQTAADAVVDDRAQAANDALERLLNSSINATTSISDVRHEATQLAITKVESQLTSAFVASKAAIDAALTTANSAVDAVDKKSLMRSEASDKHIGAVEDRLLGRLTALKDLIDLGTDMGKEAITKAENASEKRFEGLNELRGAMSDQASKFLPRAEADARFGGYTDKMEQVAVSVSATQLDMKSMMRRDDLKPVMDDITKLRDVAATSGGKNQVWGIVGGGALSIIAIVVALISVYHTPTPTSTPTFGPSIAENAKRIDDMINQSIEQTRILNSRLDALSNRLTTQTRPP